MYSCLSKGCKCVFVICWTLFVSKALGSQWSKPWIVFKKKKKRLTLMWRNSFIYNLFDISHVFVMLPNGNSAYPSMFFQKCNHFIHGWSMTLSVIYNVFHCVCIHHHMSTKSIQGLSLPWERIFSLALIWSCQLLHSL